MPPKDLQPGLRSPEGGHPVHVTVMENGESAHKPSFADPARGFKAWAKNPGPFHDLGPGAPADLILEGKAPYPLAGEGEVGIEHRR